jgi:hypothetical protein
MHKSCPIQFALCVDDFGVKYVNKEDVEHLKAALTTSNPETGKPMFDVRDFSRREGHEALWPFHGLGLRKR